MRTKTGTADSSLRFRRVRKITGLKYGPVTPPPQRAQNRRASGTPITLGITSLLFLAAGIVAAGILMTVLPVAAHHGAAEYDNTKTISMQGTVTALQYLNPHALILFNVKDEKGQVSEWTAELQSPNLLTRRGWSRRTLKPGDQIIVTGHPVKNGAKAMSGQKVVFSDGRETPNMGLPADSPK